MKADWLFCNQDVVPDYEVIEDGKAIRFYPCRIVSRNLHDIRNHYCARCHRFIDDVRNRMLK